MMAGERPLRDARHATASMARVWKAYRRPQMELGLCDGLAPRSKLLWVV